MIAHLLIANDGSDTAEKALDRGLDLARQLSARVTVLYASERWSALEMAEKAREGSPNPVEEFNRMTERHAQAVLARAQTKAMALSVPCDLVHLPDSTPAEAIVAEADRREADMIIMASHGRRGLDRVLLGSQTARVLALTTRPVLVYR
jgi:nucleotide-binding universal stress UspA family protein